MTESQKKAQKKYDNANKHKFRIFTLKFNRQTDKFIIEQLESVGNIQGYIRELILADIHDSL